MVERPNTIWRDYNVDGVFASGKYDPKKAEIRAWGEYIQAFLNAGNFRGYTSKDNLDADLAHDAGEMAVVIGDPTVANNGLYLKSGASGAGSWTRIANVPGYAFEVATDDGGSANAIEALLSSTPDSSKMIAVPVNIANTATPVTISFNGGSTLTIKTNSGNNPAVGGLTVGSLLLGVIQGSTFRLFSDQSSAAIQAASEQAASDAADSATLAVNTVAAAFQAAVTQESAFPTRDIIGLTDVPVGRDHIPVLGRAALGDAAPHAYQYVASEPSHAGKIQSNNGRWFEIINIDRVPLSAFDTFDEAMAWYAAKQGRLWLDEDFDFATAVNITQLGAGIIEVRNGVVGTYTGSHVAKAIQIALGGFDLRLAGELTINANSLANNPLHISNASGTPRLDIDALNVHNAKMISGVAGGAFGMILYGAYDTIKADTLRANGVTREAGTGIPGTYGSQGIVITGTNTGGAKWAQNVDIGTARVENVNSEDADGAAGRVDIDGLGIFQDVAKTDTRARVGFLHADQCIGRALKLQSEGQQVIEGAFVHRNGPGITGGSSDLNFQYGKGILKNARIVYEGAAHTRGTIPVSGYRPGASLANMAPLEIDGLYIEDKSTGSETMDQIAHVSPGYFEANHRRFRFANFKLDGKTTKYAIASGSLGGSVRADIMLNNIQAEMTVAVVSCNQNVPNLNVYYQNVRNPGTSVPTRKRVDAASMGFNWGMDYSLGGNNGIDISYGNFGATPGLNAGMEFGGGYPVANAFTTSLSGGRRQRGRNILAAGATLTFQLPGYSSTRGLVTVEIDGYQRIGQFNIYGTTIDDLISITNVVTSDSGSDPGSGTIRMWVTGGVLYIKSYDGSNRYLNVETFG